MCVMQANFLTYDQLATENILVATDMQLTTNMNDDASPKNGDLTGL
jgi:hypothetical protein